MSQITVTLPDGSRRDVPAGTAVVDVAASISPRLAKAALAGQVDGRLVDLCYPLQADSSVKVITADNPEALADAFLEFWRDPARATAVGLAGADGVRKHYSVDCMAETAERLHAELAGRTAS